MIQDGMRDLTMQMQKRDGGTIPLQLRQAKVTAVTGDTLTVTLDGTSITGVRKLASYAPTVNDTVWLFQNGGDLLAIDRTGAEAFAKVVHDHPGQWDDPALAVTGDWNSYTESGIYRGSGLTNQTPFKQHSWQYTLVIRHDANYVRQVAFDYYHANTTAGSGAVSTRVLLAGTWRPWALVGGDDTGWQVVSNFFNGATAYSTDINNSYAPRYRRKNGIVYLDGLINTGSTTSPITVAQLPAGFRPRSIHMDGAFFSGGGVRRMDIASDGYITFREAVGTITAGWHNISTSFVADA